MVFVRCNKRASHCWKTRAKLRKKNENAFDLLYFNKAGWAVDELGG